MYNHNLYQQINAAIQNSKLDITGNDNNFYTRLVANATAIKSLFDEIYGNHPNTESSFKLLLEIIIADHNNRSKALKTEDAKKEQEGIWFLNNKLAGMSLYVDRFCGNIKNLESK